MEHRKYIDVLGDSAFKIVFTKTSNKMLIISLLNGLLKGLEEIVDITFGKNEQQGGYRGTGNCLLRYAMHG